MGPGTGVIPVAHPVRLRYTIVVMIDKFKTLSLSTQLYNTIEYNDLVTNKKVVVNLAMKICAKSVCLASVSEKIPYKPQFLV